MATARSRLPSIVFSLMALVLWALAAVFLWAGLGNTWYGWVSEGWPTAEGRILVSQVEEIRATRVERRSSNDLVNPTPRGPIIRYRPVIKYQWQVGGNLYQRDRRNFSAAVADEDTPEAAEAIIAAYEAGERVSVYYDPDQPSRGILEPGPHWDGFGVSLVVAMILAGFAAVFSWLGLRGLSQPGPG
ncbi:MAG: DUF3592 domain-containing protein [Xanthomonadales bacterium]|jgi:hypothetical protein|nr:DUF3592 domain-containing protein [Xanthomonadales bacterium]